MPDEGFMRRWSRRKLESRQRQEPAPEPLRDAPPADSAPDPQALAEAHALHARAPEAAGIAELATEPPRLPTLDDVAALTPDSDYSSFVARGVDQAVRRSALKKLFADPHFNTMDRLDIYIDDYNKPSPLSDAMLASLRHAARLFDKAVETQAEAVTDDPQDPPDQQDPPETETR